MQRCKDAKFFDPPVADSIRDGYSTSTRLRLFHRFASRKDIVGLWVGLFLLGAVVLESGGQQYASQQGHALDANPGIGTFGLNTVQRFDPLVPRVNLYITGNVRGGGRFQGLIPYRSVQELNLNLGSGTLSDFRRDSTGALDLGLGVGAVRPWVDVSRQVTRSSGGTIINTYRVHQQARRVHPALERGGGNYRLAVRPFSLRGYSLNVDVGSQGYGTNPYTPAGSIYQMELLEGAAAGHSFSEILQQERLGPQPDWRPLLGAQRSDATIRERSEGKVKSSEEPTSQVQQMLEELQEAIPGPLEFSRGGISESSGGAGEQVRGELGPSTAKRIVEGVAPAISDIRKAQAAQYIEQGEALMREGSYYQAAEAFGAAAVHAGERVEVLQAKAHALFAAGEFMSSAYYLDRAIRVSEPKMKERIDLRGLFKDAESFEKRLDDLNRWYERTEHKTLLFLKGYVHYQMGEVAEARAALVEVQEGEPSMESAKVMLEWLDGNGQ